MSDSISGGASGDLVAVAHALADASAEVILPHFRSGLQIDNKAGKRDFDPVTIADRAAEQVIRDLLAERCPEHDILGEEFAPTAAADGQVSAYRWVIDPIDGTRAFILGLPTWGTLIGLEFEGRPIVGLMNQPFTAERFWSDGSRAFFRGRDGITTQLRTRACSLAEAQLATTSPDLFEVGAEQDAFARIKAATRACRFGTDCYAYCLLAAGLVDVVMEAGLKPYDIVALIPIIEQAGGVVTNWAGGSAAAGGQVLACGDPALHAQIIGLLSKTG